MDRALHNKEDAGQGMDTASASKKRRVRAWTGHCVASKTRDSVWTQSVRPKKRRDRAWTGHCVARKTGQGMDTTSASKEEAG